jgi:hypothetical protein
MHTFGKRDLCGSLEHQHFKTIGHVAGENNCGGRFDGHRRFGHGLLQAESD